MIDSHIHLDADQYADVAGLIKRAREAGVNSAIVPGITPASNRRVMELAAEHPGFVHAALGFHPERLELTDDDVEATIQTIRKRRESICAVGEVGLPYYGERARDSSIVQRGRRILARFAALAVELHLPLILHCPHETARDALGVIGRAMVRRAVFHWHKSDEATTRAIIAAGYFISITPEVVYRERDQVLAKMVPLANLMVETDGPWPYRGPFTGKATEPAMVADAVRAIASLKNVEADRIAEATTANSRELFRI